MAASGRSGRRQPPAINPRRAACTKRQWTLCGGMHISKTVSMSAVATPTACLAVTSRVGNTNQRISGTLARAVLFYEVTTLPVTTRI